MTQNLHKQTYPFSYVAHKCSFTQHISLHLYNICRFVYWMWLYICLLYVSHCAFMWIFCATYMFSIMKPIMFICVFKMFQYVWHIQTYVQIYVHNICFYVCKTYVFICFVLCFIYVFIWFVYETHMYQHMFHICLYVCYLTVYVCDMYASAPWQLSRNKLYIAFEFS